MQFPANKLSCFSDQPIKSKDDDHLKNNQYAKGLLEFIKIADAPITIGIQGGWGSGKTSLINLLQHELETSGDSLCINVNAWQQSLFANSGKSGEIALSLLENAYGELAEQIQEKHKTGKIRVSEEQKQNILRLGKTVVRLTAAFAGIALPTGDDSVPHLQQRPSQAFKKLRRDLNEAIQSLIADKANKLERIVIFVDDLDRIQPDTAVEVLDVLKNVFDIENCISVLAIDYDVVIKGLRKKFGDQLNNQREFRQYFDKIIQIPFSMPTGAYRDNIPVLLERLLEKVLPGLVGEQNRDELIEDVTRVILLATDGVPRSIKRIINTLSLLSIIEATAPSETDKASQYLDATPDLQFRILLTVVCLQVSFPEIHKALCRLPNPKNWDEETTRSAWHLSLEEDDERLCNLEGDFSSFDWEPALLKLILQHELTQKAADIRDIILELHALIDEPGGIHALRKTLRSTSITDTDSENNQTLGTDISKDDANRHCGQLLETLLAQTGNEQLGRINKKRVAKRESEFWTLMHKGLTSAPIQTAGLEQIEIVLDAGKMPPSYSFEFYIPRARRSEPLRSSILSAGFSDRHNFEWFEIGIPANPAGGLEPNMEGFFSETLPRIRKVLEVLG